MSHLKAFGIEEGKGKYHEEIVYSLILIYNLIADEITDYLKDYNLNPGKFNILMVVKHQGKGDGLPQVEVSRRLIVTPSNMTKMIDKLQQEGLVTRGTREGDRRINIVKIAPKGAKLLDEAWGGYDKRVKELVADLDMGKQKQLASVLLQWINMKME